MTILVAGNNKAMTHELSDTLKSLRTDADIVVAHDALMAGQYSFNNTVDMVFAQINMKRMSGIQLIEFVKHEHPLALTYLVGSKAEFDEWPIAADEDITNVVTYPFSVEKIKKLFVQSKR